MKILQQGAEAVISLDKNVVTKERIKKNYRIPEIDDKIRKFRTRRETKILQKAEIPVPKVLSSDDKEMKIKMQYIDGELLKDYLDKVNKKKRKEICKEIGENTAKIHNQNIVHGDLTTSNMILKDKVYFIDFGLSSVSDKIEAKAVDIHLLRQAFEAKHHEHSEEMFKSFLKGYKKCKHYKQILERLKKVESRGRYKKR